MFTTADDFETWLENAGMFQSDDEEFLASAEAVLVERENFRQAALYLAGFDVAGWEAHMRPDEVLSKVGLDPSATHTPPEGTNQEGERQ